VIFKNSNFKDSLLKKMNICWETKQINPSFSLLQRTSLQQKVKKKYKRDHDSSPSHSEEPLMQTDEGRQSESHCTPLKEFIKEELKEAFCEIFERNKYDTCLKKELPHISKERKQLRVNSSHFKRNIFHVWWEMHL
jgi:hypothetical protein